MAHAFFFFFFTCGFVEVDVWYFSRLACSVHNTWKTRFLPRSGLTGNVAGGGGASNVAPRFNRCFSHPHPGGAQVLKRISSVKAERTLSPKQEIYSATLQTCDAATLEYAYQIPSYHLAANTGQRGYVLVNLALGLHGADTTLGKKKIYIWTVSCVNLDILRGIRRAADFQRSVCAWYISFGNGP